MSELPIGFGNEEAQKQFIRKNEAFLRESRLIYLLLTKAFVRTLAHPSEEAVEGLADGDPAVIEFENKVTANRLVFYLGRMASEDFSELLILAANGYGIGALKILRGMYERIVTAAYIAKNASEARVFAEDDVIKKWKLWQELSATMPDIVRRYTGAQVQQLKERNEAIRIKRKKDICSKCRQPITQEAWTRVTVKDMATRADPNLAGIYGPCYLEPTFHSHPTAYSLGTRLRETEEGGYSFNETNSEEARRALLLGHNLILRSLELQNEYFHLELDAGIQERYQAFSKVWDEPA